MSIDDLFSVKRAVAICGTVAISALVLGYTILQQPEQSAYAAQPAQPLAAATATPSGATPTPVPPTPTATPWPYQMFLPMATKNYAGGW